MAGNRVLVGCARVDVTPPLDVPYLGFQPRQAIFRGVHDPLHARAAVFRTDETATCILSVDAIGIDNRMLGPGRSFVGELRERIASRSSIPGANVLLASTHAHSTPETLGISRAWELDAMRSWIETFLDRLVAAALGADAAAVPCTLKAGSGTLLGVGYNRRPAARKLPPCEQAARGLLDPELSVLVCEDSSGAARCVVLHYACHAVTVQVQPLVSADYPGVACRLVEEQVPGRPTCLFLQGAAGNVNPVRDDTRDFRDVELHGLAVGGEALAVLSRLMGDAGCAFREPRIRVRATEVLLPPRTLPPRAEVERRVAAARDLLAREERDGDDAALLSAAASLRGALEALDLLERFSSPQPAELQVVRVGDLAIAASPGELFAEWGLSIKRASPAPYTFVTELANGWVGYLMSPGSFEEGGYESGLGTWTQTNEEGARLVAEGLGSLIGEVWC